MRAVALLGLSLALGCKGDKPTQPVAKTMPPQDAQARPDAPPAVEPAHVRLPRSPDTPPHRTTRPLGRKELERLSALELPDFEREDRGTTEESTEFRHTTATRPTLGVTVKIERCGRTPPPARAGGNAAAAPKPGPRACLAMELGPWQARAEQLKQALPAELLARPDTRFELGVRDLSGAPTIYTYQLGAFFGNDEKGQPTGSYSDAYILYYNDGVNQIRVNAAYLDDAIGGIDHLLAVAPPEDLEKLAVAFLGFYVHEWRD
jgi:hypothetical protein